MKLLLECGEVDADLVDNEGCASLARLAAISQEKIVYIHLARGSVAINFKDRDRYTPLSWAAGRGHDTMLAC